MAARRHQCRTGGVGDVQERNADGRLNSVGEQVHGVGAQDQRLRSGVLEPAGGVGQQLASRRPFAAMLQLGDFGEVDGPEQQTG